MNESMAGATTLKRLYRKLLLHPVHRTQEGPWLVEQGVHFTVGCCLIRQLLMLTLYVFSLLYLLSVFIISYFGLMLLVYKI